MCGPSAWQELIRMEKDIRQQRKETIYKQREARKHFLEAIAIVFLGITIVGFFILLLYLWHNRGV
jgi:polyferredoxin